MGFQEFMDEYWCYNCCADEGAGDCKEHNNPKCVAFVFKYGEKILHWTPNKQYRKYRKFKGKYKEESD